MPIRRCPAAADGRHRCGRSVPPQPSWIQWDGEGSGVTGRRRPVRPKRFAEQSRQPSCGPCGNAGVSGGSSALRRAEGTGIRLEPIAPSIEPEPIIAGAVGHAGAAPVGRGSRTGHHLWRGRPRGRTGEGCGASRPGASTAPAWAPRTPSHRARPSSLARLVGPSLLAGDRAELERRAQCGEMLEQWRPEARALTACGCKASIRMTKTPMFESIERQLRNALQAIEGG